MKIEKNRIESIFQMNVKESSSLRTLRQKLKLRFQEKHYLRDFD